MGECWSVTDARACARACVCVAQVHADNRWGAAARKAACGSVLNPPPLRARPCLDVQLQSRPESRRPSEFHHDA